MNRALNRTLVGRSARTYRMLVGHSAHIYHTLIVRSSCTSIVHLCRVLIEIFIDIEE
jgi:hypothetical protein